MDCERGEDSFTGVGAKPGVDAPGVAPCARAGACCEDGVDLRKQDDLMDPGVCVDTLPGVGARPGVEPTPGVDASRAGVQPAPGVD